jgi:hypothetical protein
MRIPRTKLAGAWSVTIIGLALTALPLYSRLFTMEEVNSSTTEEVSSKTTEESFSESTSVSYTMMYVPEWVPFGGGILALIGGVLVGRGQKFNANATDA